MFKPRIVLLACLFTFCSGVAVAVPSDRTSQFQQQLRSDLVVRQGELFILERYDACFLTTTGTIEPGTPEVFRVRTRLQEPASGMLSRDDFVVFAAELLHGSVIGFAGDLVDWMTPLEALSALQCRQLPGSQGPFDFALTFTIPPWPDSDDQPTSQAPASSVRLYNGRLALEQVDVCLLVFSPEAKVETGRLFQIGTQAHILPGVSVSRDLFLSLVTKVFRDSVIEIGSKRIEDMAPIEALSALQCLRSIAPHDPSDYRLTISFSTEGIQYEVKDLISQQSIKHEKVWADVLYSQLPSVSEKAERSKKSDSA